MSIGAYGEAAEQFGSNMLKSRSTGPGSKTPDPVGALRFKVDVGAVEGKTIGFFSECSGLSVEMTPFPIEEGGENRFVHKYRSRLTYPNLVLKRGITHEEQLMAWFYKCQDKTERHDISVSLLGPNGKPVRSWKFLDGFPVKWQGPTFNAGQASVATETLEIAHHGFAPEG